MIRLKTLKLGALKTNCYLVWDNASSEALVIDPADEADYILQVLTENEILPRYIVATHGHFDHNLASLELVLSLKIPFAASPQDEFLLKKIAASAAYWQKLKNEPVLSAPPISLPLTEKKNISLGKEIFTILETPGHTPGGVCLFHRKEGLLFSGDTLFAQAVGRTDLAYSSPANLTQSIRKIFTLPAETKVYPGHGRATTLKEEKFFCREAGYL